MVASVLPLRLLLSLSAYGTKRSAAAPGVNTLEKSNDAGNTPITVTGCSFSVIAFPTMRAIGAELLAPRFLRQYRRRRAVVHTLVGTERATELERHAEEWE